MCNSPTADTESPAAIAVIHASMFHISAGCGALANSDELVNAPW